MIIRICDFNIEIKNKYPYSEKMCKNYISDKNEKCLFDVSVTDEEIAKKRATLSNPQSDGYLEFIIIYKKIVDKLLNHNCFFMHGCVVSLDGEGYVFTAPSGTGKSTHSLLWLEYFKDRAFIVNGDKPIIKKENDGFYAYGTPWCGKERIEKNTRVRIKYVCCLERGEKNEAHSIDNGEAAVRILDQIERPKTADKAALIMSLLDEFISNVPFCVLKCNKDINAAVTAYEFMNRQNK